MSKNERFLTRNDVLIYHLDAYLRERGISEARFADRLVETYFTAVPEGYRQVPLAMVPREGSADQFAKIQASNLRAFQRWRRRDVRIPLELEEAWVQALEEPFRGRCKFDLCARHGVLPVLLDVDADVDVERIAQFMESEADVIRALVPLLADGVINEADKAGAPEAQQKIARAIADLAGLARRIEVATGVKSSLHLVAGDGA